MGERVTLPGEGEVFTVEDYATREDWLSARERHGFDVSIGGTDAVSLWAAEIGADGGKTFGSPYATFCQKAKLIPYTVDADEPDYIRIGRKMEPVIAELFAENEGVNLVYPGPFAMLRSIAHPWLAVSLDRVILADLPGVLECKNRSVNASKDWRDGLPLAVQVQIAHALLVTGWTWGAGAAIVGGNTYAAHRYERDEAFLALHFARCAEMVQRVRDLSPPEPIGHDADLHALQAIYAADNGESIAATAELAEAVESWAGVREAAKVLTQEEADAEAKIRAMMGAASLAVLPDGRRMKLATEGRKARICACGEQIQAGWTKRIPRLLKGGK